MRIAAVLLVGAFVVGLAAAQKQDELEYDGDYDYDNEAPVKDTPPTSAKKDASKDNGKTNKPGADTAANNEDTAGKKKADGPTSILFRPRNTRNKLTPSPVHKPKPTLPPFIKSISGGVSTTTTTHRPVKTSSRTTTTTTRKPARGSSSSSNKKSSRTTTAAPTKETGRRYGSGATSKTTSSKDSKPSRYSRNNN